MNLSLKRRLRVLEGNRSPLPYEPDKFTVAALRQMTDEELALLGNVIDRCPRKAETVEEEAAVRHYEAEFASAKAASTEGGR